MQCFVTADPLLTRVVRRWIIGGLEVRQVHRRTVSVGRRFCTNFGGRLCSVVSRSIIFFWRCVLKPAGELLWSFVRGNELRKLDELPQGPMPPAPVNQQPWKLKSLGFSRPQLVATVKLLGEASWSTLPAEQQHGTLAKLHK